MIWSELPNAVACQIFSDVVGSQQDAAVVARFLAPISLCCRSWNAAVKQTFIKICISDEAYISEPTAKWLSKHALQGFTLSVELASELQVPTAPFLTTAVAPSVPSLVSLSGISSLHPLRTMQLRSLRFLSLHCPKPKKLRLGKGVFFSQPLPELLDFSFLQHLKIRSLSLSGHFRLANLSRAPCTLAHLRLSSYEDKLSVGSTPPFCLPAGILLDTLRLKARVVWVGDWRQLCSCARSVHVTASRMEVGMPAGGGTAGRRRLAAASMADFGDADLALYREFAWDVADPEELAEVVLHFQRLKLFTAPAFSPANPVSTSGSARSPPAPAPTLSRSNPPSANASSSSSRGGASLAAELLTQLAAQRGLRMVGEGSSHRGDPPTARGGAAPPGLPPPEQHPPWVWSPSRPSPSAAQPEAVSVWVDGFEMLAALREELLGSHMVRTCYGSCHFSSDELAHNDVASVLRIQRQPGTCPRSFCFLTPTTPREQALLLSTPASALEWSADPFAPLLLRNPSFIAVSAETLRYLGPIPVTPGLDLSPFKHLTELHGLLTDPAAMRASWTTLPPPPAHTAAAARARAAGRPAPIVLPPTLALLGLQCGDGFPPHFDVTPLAAAGPIALRELRLAGFATHDLRALPAGITTLCVINPRTGPSGPPLGGDCINLPSWQWAPPAPTPATLLPRREGGGRGRDGLASDAAIRVVAAQGARVGVRYGLASRFSSCWGAPPVPPPSPPSHSRCTPHQDPLAIHSSGALSPFAASASASTSCSRLSRLSSDGSALDLKPADSAKELADGEEGRPQLTASGGKQTPGKAGAAARPPSAPPPFPPTPAGLHLHISSAGATELAVDLSWALRQPALRGLTVEGSQTLRGQLVRLQLAHAARGLPSSPKAAGRQLARELGAAAGLEILEVVPYLSTVTVQPAVHRLLQRMGVQPRPLPLKEVLEEAGRKLRRKASPRGSPAATPHLGRLMRRSGSLGSMGGTGLP